VNIFDDFKLNGKVAIVKGASSGLGAAFPRALADTGAVVALGARRTERLALLASDIERSGRRAIAVPADVAPRLLTAIDVYEFEPSVRASLLSMGNVVLAPHIGSGTRRTREELGMLAGEGCVPC